MSRGYVPLAERAEALALQPERAAISPRERIRLDVLLLALAVLACAVGGVVSALTANGRSVRSAEPLQRWPLRLFTASVALVSVGLLLVFVAQLPWLRDVADNEAPFCFASAPDA